MPADPTSEYHPAGTMTGVVIDFWQRPIPDLGLTSRIVFIRPIRYGQVLEGAKMNS
jgi:hypothetical protein